VIEVTLANHDPTKVAPVLVTASKRLVDDEILGRTCRDRFVVRDLESRGPLDGMFFERHRAERDVDMDPIARREQECPVEQGKFACISDAPVKRREEGVDVTLLSTESR
jgi:hypothetical protein